MYLRIYVSSTIYYLSVSIYVFSIYLAADSTGSPEQDLSIYVNAQNADGRSALMNAACEGHSDIIKLLLSEKGEIYYFLFVYIIYPPI